jgi:hypothetical protein
MIDRIIRNIQAGQRVSLHRDAWLPAYLAATPEDAERIVEALVAQGSERSVIKEIVDGVASLPEDARRELQRATNKLIGDYVPSMETPSMSLEEMVERCYYIHGTDSVAVCWHNDRVTLHSVPSFNNLMAGSVELVIDERGRERTHKTAKAWLESADRHTLASATFAIGQAKFIRDPEDKDSVNLWTEKPRKPSSASIKPFLAHIRYLVPIKKERRKFIQWLAHCEQCPQVLPHSGWLFFTETFGIGRNWLSSLLTRVWRGEVAPSLDLGHLLGNQFNYRIAGKRLAVVDEIHLGEQRSIFTISAKLRQLITEEMRVINPKFGREYYEWSALRWLIFSNHADAIPLQKEERRFHVVANPTQVKPAEYYTKLYNLLKGPRSEDFINAVRNFLSRVDISDFNPGEKPELNAAKLRVVEATTPEFESEITALLRDMAAAGIKTFAAAEVADALSVSPQKMGLLTQILRRLRCVSLGRHAKDKKRYALWTLPGVDLAGNAVDAALAEVAGRRGDKAPDILQKPF